MNGKKEIIKEEVKSRGKRKKEEIEKNDTCGDCKYYDKSTEREFHRDGIRKGLVEVRAICRNEKVKALVTWYTTFQ